MKSTIQIKAAIHRLAYSISIFLPLALLWEKLHSRDYHPNVDGITARISQQREESNTSLFIRLGQQLDYRIELQNKTVLEIGHGGGWYLASALDSGAREVAGLEISDEINRRAACALQTLGYQNYKLYLGDGKDLNVLKGFKFDFIFSITVLQHMPTWATKKYLQGMADLLDQEGMCVIQTLGSYGPSMKRLSGVDLFSVAYSEKEFDNLLKVCGFQIIRSTKEEYGSDKTYWGIYLIRKLN
jgi:protein-L-isoaspartate O-methyltransferase